METVDCAKNALDKRTGGTVNGGVTLGQNLTISWGGRTATYHENGDITGPKWGGALSRWLNVHAVTPEVLRVEIPVGVPLPWPTETPPSGWRICNGESFDKKQCPLLALAYPSGKLPDLRGEFIRGWDAGRKVDNGREILSVQGDSLQNFTGNITGIQFVGQSPTSGIFKMGSRTGGSSIGSGTSGVFAVDCSASFQSGLRTASETRPRNVAFNYIVRAA